MRSLHRDAAPADRAGNQPSDEAHQYGNDEPLSRHGTRGRMIAFAVAGLVGLTALIMFATRPERLDVPVTEIQAVQTGHFEEYVLASGRVVPLRMAVVTTVVAGRIDHARVRRGDTVRAGEELLQLENPELSIAALEAERIALRATDDAARDTEQASLQVRTAEQRVLEGRLDLREAQQAVQEAEQLLSRALIASAELPRRRDRLAASRARVSADSVALQWAVADLRRRRIRAPAEEHLVGSLRIRQRERVAALIIRAPVTGVLQEFDVTPGEWLQPGQSVARLMLDGGLGARLEVYEADAAKVARGQTVRLITQADTARGKVERVAPAAREGRVLVDVSIDDAATTHFRPEQSVTAEIVVKEVSDATIVRRPSWIRAPGLYDMLCVDREERSAEICHIEVTAAGGNAMMVAARHKGVRIVVGGTGPPFTASRYRLR